ncbi:hypothetical protein CLOM_g5380 [Closterium sp. NIES-68]|nr:hypothetical protein CLOM_g5380 [Closterium sp. NIES-68]
MAGSAEGRVVIVGDGGSPAAAGVAERAAGARRNVVHLAHPKTGASVCYVQQGDSELEAFPAASRTLIM